MRTPLLMVAASLIVAALCLPVRAQRPAPPRAPDPIASLVARLDLERYKATIKGLTQFGDRRQGTDRNRAAVDWIEAQLKSYGCTNTERITYDYQPTARGAGRGTDTTGQRGRGGQRGGARGASQTASGGGRPRGIRSRTGVN